MNGTRRLMLLIVLCVVAAGISAWINVPPWLTRRRAAEHYRQGLDFARQEEMAKALAEWRIAARIDPDYPEPQRKLADFLLNKAERPDLASRIYLQLTAIDPNGPHIYCNLTKAFLLQNEQAEAYQYARLAVKAEPECGLAHNMLGILLMTGHQMKQGLPELERSCRLSPSNTIFALVLAQAYLDTSDFTSAKRVLADLLRREPGNAKAHFLMGWTYTHGPRTPENIAEALGHFQQATRIDPDAADTHSEWGKLLLQSARPQQACRELEKAWAINPRIVQVAHNLTIAYRQLGQKQKAHAMEQQSQRLLERSARLRILQKEAQVKPGDVNITLQLADAEMQDGNLTDALHYVQGVLRVQPADRRALDLLARIYIVGGKPDMAEAVHKHLRELPGPTP